MIPKILHRVWFDIGKGSVPPDDVYGSMRRSFRYWHEVHRLDAVPRTFADAHRYLTETDHPDGSWKVIEWSREMAEDLIADRYPWFLDLWYTYKEPIFQIDSIRYMILLQYGGFYADQDIRFYRPIDFLAQHDAVLVDSRAYLRINNFFVGCPAGSQFMRYAVESLPRAHSSWLHIRDSAVGTMCVAGPFFLERCVREFRSLHPETDIRVLPRYAFEPQRLESHVDRGETIDWDGYSVGFHESHKSWDGDHKIMMDIVRLGAVVIALAVVSAVIVCVLVRKYRSCARSEYICVAIPEVFTPTSPA